MWNIENTKSSMTRRYLSYSFDLDFPGLHLLLHKKYGKKDRTIQKNPVPKTQVEGRYFPRNIESTKLSHQVTYFRIKEDRPFFESLVLAQE